MQADQKAFGVMPNGEKAFAYTLENKLGMQVEITNLGGIILKICVPDQKGVMRDVVLGHNSFEDYLTNPYFLGALIGRNSNRIADAMIEIEGTRYQLDKNSGNNNLHGGLKGLHTRLMSGRLSTDDGEPSLLLSCIIPDMDDGLPGNLSIEVKYTLQNDNTLLIEYFAVSDKTTIINLTNHAYFNVAGHDSGNACDQLLTLDSTFYTPNTSECLPTGEILNVAGTPFDFSKGKSLREGIYSDNPQIEQFGGYDHNLLLNGDGFRKVGMAIDTDTGHFMEFFTTLPAVQLFTYNGVPEGTKGKGGIDYNSYQGYCLESQLVPDAANMPWLRSPIYQANQPFIEKTAYRFGTL